MDLHNITCICIPYLFYFAIDSDFQYVEGVTVLSRLLEGNLSGNKWPLGAGQVSQPFGVMQYAH